MVNVNNMDLSQSNLETHEDMPELLYKKHDLVKKESESMILEDETQCLKKSIFEKAEDLINGDRQQSYGPALSMCKHIAEMWNAYLGLYGNLGISPEQVPYMMVLFKMARESYKHKEDNLVDMLGYIGVADKVRKGE